MAVDLSDLIDSVKREVNAPGLDQLAGATDAEYLGNLQDGFWEAVLDGVILGYTESDGIVTPQSGDTDLARELQQLIVLYAGFRIVRNQLRDLKTAFKTSAGPVSYEIEQSANVLKLIMDDLTQRRSIVMTRLSDIYASRAVYFDAVQTREDSLVYGDGYWVGSGNDAWGR